MSIGTTTTPSTPAHSTPAGLDLSQDLVRQYAQANPPLLVGDRLPAIPDEFITALEHVDPHDPAAFRQVLADCNIDDAAALLTMLRVVRHYGATAAAAWIGTEISRTNAG